MRAGMTGEVKEAKQMLERIDKTRQAMRWDLASDIRLDALALLLRFYIIHEETETDK